MEKDPATFFNRRVGTMTSRQTTIQSGQTALKLKCVVSATFWLPSTSFAPMHDINDERGYNAGWVLGERRM